jgi:phosphopantetheinyl transferase
MPLFFQQDINDSTRLGVWRIDEDESFFLQQVPLQREITHPKKRSQHLAGRFLLRFLFPEFPIGSILIADTHKPFVADESFHFSISHCDDTAAAIVSRSARVGVDVEIATPRVHRIIDKFLHPEERSWMEMKCGGNPALLTSSLAIRLPTLLWSAKEAVFKWYGEGKVDFSEHIRLLPFDMKESGSINAFFLKDGRVPLQLQYRWLDSVCLCSITE